jgi:subtilase family serine protease
VLSAAVAAGALTAMGIASAGTAQAGPASVSSASMTPASAGPPAASGDPRAGSAGSPAAGARAPLPGTHPAWAVASRLVATPDAGASVTARVYLAGRDPAAMAKYAAAVSDPASKSYRRFLTAKQERARYGPTSSQVSAISRWLTVAGLHVTSTTAHYVATTGTVSAAERAFAVRLGSFRGPGGGVAMAPEQITSVPATLRPAVLTVTGLDTATVVMRPATTAAPPPAFYRAGPCSQYYGQKVATTEPRAYGRRAAWAVCGYTPAQLRGAYGVHEATTNGSDVTVAVIDAYASPYLRGDVSTWAGDLGEPGFARGQYQQVVPRSFDNASLCGPAGWYEEQTLDVEAVHAMAPDADIEYVGAEDCTFQPLLDALTDVVDHHLADIVTNSWTGSEDGLTAADTAVFDQVFEQGAIEGIGFDFASGDCGYNDPRTTCGASEDSAAEQVSFPTSSTWVTGVGGTSLAIGKNDNYEWESGWGSMLVTLKKRHWTPVPPGRYPADYAYGSGGGTSVLYPQPAYQQGVVPRSLATRLPDGKIGKTPMREVPDVAMDADPSTGFLIGETVRLASGQAGFMFSRIGGTSLATPLFAGIEADAAAATGPRELGFINPTLYSLAGSAALHDITGAPLGPRVRIGLARDEWTNTATGTGKVIPELFTLGDDGAGLTVTRGYDDVTGLGSPATRFITDLADS